MVGVGWSGVGWGQYMTLCVCEREGGREGGGEAERQTETETKNDLTHASHLRHILITHAFQYLFVTNSVLYGTLNSNYGKTLFLKHPAVTQPEQQYRQEDHNEHPGTNLHITEPT